MAVFSGSTTAAILLGLLIGLVGFLPMFAVGVVKNQFIREYSVQVGIVAIGFSLILMFVAFLVCSRVAPDSLLAFSLSAILALLVLTAIFAIRSIQRTR